MKDYYFSHDRNAVIDEKILEMRARYGMEGYGCFWAVIEMLFKKDDLKLPLRAGTFAALTMMCNPTLDMEQYIKDCIEIGLFESDGECFWSNSLIRRSNDFKQCHRNTETRNSTEYRLWRSAVLKRDNYKCQHCGQKGGALQAHHIKKWSKHSEIRFELSNGITLCKVCHKAEHKGKGKRNG